MKRMPLIALAALPLTAGVVLASTATQTAQRVQSTQSAQGTAATPQTGRAQPSGTNYAEVYLQKLAAQLGITVDKLRAAAVAAGGATVDQAVKAGDIPSERAAAMKQRLQDRPQGFGGRGFGGAGGWGPRGHDHNHGPRGALPSNQGHSAPATESTSGT